MISKLCHHVDKITLLTIRNIKNRKVSNFKGDNQRQTNETRVTVTYLDLKRLFFIFHSILNSVMECESYNDIKSADPFRVSFLNENIL
jgi:hypothetical protein